MSIEYACAELLWYLSGTANTSMLQAYAPQYKRFTEDDGRAHGAYGYRWRYSTGECQITRAIKILREQSATRQAVVSMWEQRDLCHALARDKKDIPCTLSLQYLLRDGELHAITTMRSNDIWLGFPYDVFAFSAMQQMIAWSVGAQVGNYYHRAGSMHIYQRDLDKIDRLSSDSMDLDHDSYEYETPKNWNYETARDCACIEEENARCRQYEWGKVRVNLKLHTNKLGPLLRDCVAICAAKWCKPSMDNLLAEVQHPKMRYLLSLRQARHATHTAAPQATHTAAHIEPITKGGDLR
jgi:hypothetical protein